MATSSTLYQTLTRSLRWNTQTESKLYLNHLALRRGRETRQYWSLPLKKWVVVTIRVLQTLCLFVAYKDLMCNTIRVGINNLWGLLFCHYIAEVCVESTASTRLLQDVAANQAHFFSYQTSSLYVAYGDKRRETYQQMEKRGQWD